MALGRLWAGRIFGTNTGNVFVRLDGEDVDLSGQMHINDSVSGPIIYTVCGQFDGSELKLEGVPKTEGENLGRLAAIAQLTSKGNVEGRWETSVGNAGTIALFPHDRSEVASTVSGQPASIQLYTERVEFGAIEVDREQIVALAESIQKEFSKSRVVIAVVSGSEQAKFLSDFKEARFHFQKADIIRIYAREKESEEGPFDRIITIEFGPKVNFAMTQGSDESWVLGKIQKIKMEVRQFERAYTTNFRKTGIGINQLMLLVAVVYSPSLPNTWSRFVLVGSVVALGIVVTSMHNKYLPYAAIYLGPKVRGGWAFVAPSVVSWLIAATAGTFAALLALYLQGRLGLPMPSP